jgi:hypothetical protein
MEIFIRMLISQIISKLLTCIRLMYQNAATNTQDTGLRFQPVNMQKIDAVF